jgi:hypothetical protein
LAVSPFFFFLPGGPPSPSPPRAQRPQGLPKPPRPPPTLELSLDPGRAPRGACDLAGDLGGRLWARGPIRIFRKKNSYGNPAKSTHGRTSRGRPTLELPWSPRARTRTNDRTDAQGRRERERGESPTLEPRTGLPYTSSRREGRKTHNQPKNQTQPRLTPTRPPGGGCIGEIEAKYGLPSADRNNKATLLLTGPFRTAKSSAKDLTPLVLKLQYAKYRGPLRGPRRNRLLRH